MYRQHLSTHKYVGTPKVRYLGWRTRPRWDPFLVREKGKQVISGRLERRFDLDDGCVDFLWKGSFFRRP